MTQVCHDGRTYQPPDISGVFKFSFSALITFRNPIEHESMASLNYADSGVDISKAEQLVEKIALFSKTTFNHRVKSSIGGYASLFALDENRWLAASTDGVGTKLKLAFRLKQHDTVGIDLVAMSVNDLLCVGAEPLFFLDYFATGKLDSQVAESVIKGIVEGCKQAGCALVGGETAEMPDFYPSGEYDLAGFAVGLLEPKLILPKDQIIPGDILIGIQSSGCHSNGFSLLRRFIPEGNDGDVIAKELLNPTKIYSRALLPLLKKNQLKGLAHITGSGFLNVPRISDQVSYEIQLPPMSDRPEIYQWIRSEIGLSLYEEAQTFNCGIGMVLAVEASQEKAILESLNEAGEVAWRIGQVVKKSPNQESEVIVQEEGRSAILRY